MAREQALTPLLVCHTAPLPPPQPGLQRIHPLVCGRAVFRLCARLKGAFGGSRARLSTRQRTLVRQAAEHLCVRSGPLQALQKLTMRVQSRQLQAAAGARAAHSRHVGPTPTLGPNLCRLFRLPPPALLPRYSRQSLRLDAPQAQDGKEVVGKEPRVFPGEQQQQQREQVSRAPLGRQGRWRHGRAQGLTRCSGRRHQTDPLWSNNPDSPSPRPRSAPPGPRTRYPLFGPLYPVSSCRHSSPFCTQLSVIDRHLEKGDAGRRRALTSRERALDMFTQTMESRCRSEEKHTAVPRALEKGAKRANNPCRLAPSSPSRAAESARDARMVSRSLCPAPHSRFP